MGEESQSLHILGMAVRKRLAMHYPEATGKGSSTIQHPTSILVWKKDMVHPMLDTSDEGEIDMQGFEPEGEVLPLFRCVWKQKQVEKGQDLTPPLYYQLITRAAHALKIEMPA